MQVAFEAVPATATAASTSTKPMSVLFFVDQLTEMGGGERILLTLARSLTKRGIAVAIVTFQGNVHPMAADPGCPLYIFPLTRTWNLQAFHTARALRRLLRVHEVDVVHTFFETSDIFGGLVASLCGVRALVSSRRDMGILRRGKHRLAYRLATPLCTRILTVSDRVRSDVLRRDHARPSRVLTIPNGVDLKPFLDESQDRGETRRSLGLPEDCLLVTTIANLQPWKRLDVFLHCAAAVLRVRPDVHFALAGQLSDAALHASLVALAHNLGISDNVHFAGPVPHAAPLLLASDVFCLLSDTEGFPNAVLEAMAAGLPVVATRVGGTPEAMLNGITGYLVEAGDSSAAAAHVLTLLSDRPMRNVMGRRGREYVRGTFSLSRMVDRHEALYRELLGQAP